MSAVDTHTPSQMAAWLRETAANTRKHSDPTWCAARVLPYDPVAGHVAFRLEQAAELVEKLADALQGLIDEQNGPPLETRREQWQRVYDHARAALTR